MLYEDNPQDEPDYTKLTLADLKDKGVVVTGEFPHLHRKIVEYYVEELGAKNRTKISDRTYMVVAGLDHGPSKRKAVIEINGQRRKEGKHPIWWLNELEFYHLIKSFGVFKKY